MIKHILIGDSEGMLKYKCTYYSGSKLQLNKFGKYIAVKVFCCEMFLHFIPLVGTLFLRCIPLMGIVFLGRKAYPYWGQ